MELLIKVFQYLIFFFNAVSSLHQNNVCLFFHTPSAEQNDNIP